MSQSPFSISMVGLGYIGLPTAVVFAQGGIRVFGYDVDAAAIAKITKGETHIVEPGLDAALKACVESGHLTASTLPHRADAHLIAVPTPFHEGTGHEPDLTFIEKAARAIAPVLKVGDLVILESTSPVGTTEQMADWLAGERPDLTFPQTHGEASDIRIAHCPERILPGHALRELVSNDRIIGGLTPACARAAQALYKTVVEGDCIITDTRTAEMAKLTENSFRDVNIAFANELSVICDRLGINVWELIRLANRHPRVNILQPGPGVGGHCIAVDPWFIVAQSPNEARIIRAAREVNDSKPEWVLAKVHQAVAEQAAVLDRPVQIACLGLAFKPDIDDLRESPALAITKRLADLYPGQVKVVEPNISVLPKVLEDKATLVATKAALEAADVVVLLVDHSPFKALARPDRGDLRLIDTRGVWAG